MLLGRGFLAPDSFFGRAGVDRRVRTLQHTLQGLFRKKLALLKPRFFFTTADATTDEWVKHLDAPRVGKVLTCYERGYTTEPV